MKKSYFGLASLSAAIVSASFLGAFFGVSQLDISTAAFNFWNNMTAAVSCLFAPLALVLGLFGFRRKNDSKTLAGIGIGLVGLPYLILLGQFALYFLK
ncbi:MAG: hypothetical protein HZB19_08280 [Chloroflexi bacterium]|nr:hypothetical protein [Chloroflexota bacterium]